MPCHLATRGLMTRIAFQRRPPQHGEQMVRYQPLKRWNVCVQTIETKSLFNLKSL